ncbi:Transferase transferring glycosyl group [Heracleum sosnowskyi]|uniref:Transferase transferring glycosyl group n=1 Tax=Heracleum sosnowskyi TaxID=360622 RepID=A0AAD8NBX0_9APIA|nr:Transferase transferring glycosyl group [Heracleum sosnowskyi]
MAQPKKSFLPLFILSVSLFSLIIFSLYPSSPQSLPLKSFIPHLETPTQTFTLTIKLLTFNRLHSLSRCLTSLSAAHYDSNQVNLHIYVDHFANGSLDLDQKLNGSHQILDFIDGFKWKFGDKIVHYRTQNVGLQAQWLESWWPSDDNEFAFVVEDDLEVSPLYFRFLKGLILEFYYNGSNYSPWIYGASLQRPRFVPGKHGNKIQLDGGTRLFLYQLVGTWGQLLFPRPWKEFRLWYDIQKTKGIKPYLEGMVTTGWYRKLGEKIWTPWFIKFIHARGYFNIYTNFLGDRALSVSHRDAGVNYGKSAGPDSYLLDESSLDFNLLEMQPLSDLKWYDFCFREVLPDRVIEHVDELGSVLNSVHKSKTIILVSLYEISEELIRNLLCHFERLNILNYIFVGPDSSFLHDLARRGHPVIDADKFYNSIKARKSINFRESGSQLRKDIYVKSYVIKKSLELGYSSWLVVGYMVPYSSESFVDSYTRSCDFFISEDKTVFFVRSSSSAQNFWVHQVIAKLRKLLMRDYSARRALAFMYVLDDVLENKITKFDFGVDIKGNAIQKDVFWFPDKGLDLLQRELQNSSMWLVDDNLSCNAVVCHQS